MATTNNSDMNVKLIHIFANVLRNTAVDRGLLRDRHLGEKNRLPVNLPSNEFRHDEIYNQFSPHEVGAPQRREPLSLTASAKGPGNKSVNQRENLG